MSILKVSFVSFAGFCFTVSQQWLGGRCLRTNMWTLFTFWLSHCIYGISHSKYRRFMYFTCLKMCRLFHIFDHLTIPTNLIDIVYVWSAVVCVYTLLISSVKWHLFKDIWSKAPGRSKCNIFQWIHMLMCCLCIFILFWLHNNIIQ